jgi:hypothetical protein
MHREARQTLREIHSLQRFEDYILIARAELASDPGNDRLRAFIDMIEALVHEEKARLVQVGTSAAA